MDVRFKAGNRSQAEPTVTVESADIKAKTTSADGSAEHMGTAWCPTKEIWEKYQNSCQKSLQKYKYITKTR